MNVGDYQFLSYLVGGIVLNGDIQMGDDDDVFAAFDANDEAREIADNIGRMFGFVA